MVVTQVLVECRAWLIARGSYIYWVEKGKVSTELKDAGRNGVTLISIGKNLWQQIVVSSAQMYRVVPAFKVFKT